MARLWTRKREEQRAPDAPASKRVESVHLDDEDQAWWAQAEINTAWRPHAPKRKDPEQRDLLAEQFGEDWRTSFLYTGPSAAQLEEERRREQQALDDQDPYKVLHVAQDATWDEIVAAHRHQARALHRDRLFGQSETDRTKSGERIRIIDLAYQELRVRHEM